MSSYFEKRNKLPEEIKSFLSSNTPRHEIERVAFMYGLEKENIPVLSEPIGAIFVAEIELKDYPAIIAKKINKPKELLNGIAYEIGKRLFLPFGENFHGAKQLLDFWSKAKSAPLISEEAAWQKVLQIEPWILKPDESEQVQQEEEEIRQKIRAAQLEKLPIEEALKQYPEIGEQLISEKQIRLKTFPEPVRPSIKNWISDYIFNVGVNNRSPFVRGEYLFHSQNGRELSPKEREQLALIFKSFEEKIPLDINSRLKMVVFTAPVTPKQTPPEKKAFPIAPPNPTRQQAEKSLAHKITPLQPPSIPEPPRQELPRNTPPTFQAPTPKPIAQSFQSDAERLRAWRKDLPLPTQQKTNQADSDWSSSNQKNIRFSSPQKLPVENSQPQQNNPFPPEKNPLYDNRPVSQSSGKRLLPKNVVDLRENN